MKANGEIPCECDAGESISLGWAQPSKEWSIEDVIHGRQYTQIRTAFRAGTLPWSDVCHSCAFLRTKELLLDNLAQKRITKIQIEPSLHCTISCPCCNRHRQIRERRKPHILDIAVFEQLLKSCRDSDYRVDFVEYCGQGEPLSHPEFPTLVSLARSILPNTRQRLITNGNYNFESALGGSLPDEIYVSCDGVYQESYGQYRINGSVDMALEFMSNAKSSCDSAPLVVWKYILFEFNDSDEELIAAQKKAMEMGIDSISFILTHTRFKSHRFDTDRINAVPVVTPITMVDRTPIHDGINVAGKPAGPNDSRLARLLRYTDCAIDEARLVGKEHLTVRGWAIGKHGRDIEGLSILCNGRKIGEATIGLPRPDVVASYPDAQHSKPGYFMTARLDQPLGRVVSVVAHIRLDKKRTEEFEVVFRFPAS